MPRISKRKTRSSMNMNPKMASNNSISTSSTHENIDEPVPVKRAHTYRQLNKKKQSLNEPGIDLVSDELISNQPVNEPKFTTSEPVPLDFSDNIHDTPISPPPLIMDTTEDIICSRFDISDYSAQNQSNGNYHPARTPLGNNRTNNNSKNVTRSYCDKGLPINIDQQETSMNVNANSTSVSIRTPAVQKTTTNSFSQISNRSSVVATDRFPRNSNQENVFNHRTSTPCPPRHDQVNNATQMVYDDSFCIESIPPETKNMLYRFPEFRRLVKAYKVEKNKCKGWMNDFARLQKKYDRLEESSFPRPPAPALNYLIDLVTHIQQSSGIEDTRTHEELATDLNINGIILMSLRDSTPQQTALNVFNYLYSGYSVKTKLDSVANLEIQKPGLLETILVFAQRSAPGVGYRLTDLRDTLSNSIRGARFHSRKKAINLDEVAAFLVNDNVNMNNPQNDLNRNANNNDPIDVIDINMVMDDQYGE